MKKTKIPLWYLSFADVSGWLGGCIVRGRTIVEAASNAHAAGCNPGGQVLGGTVENPGPRHRAAANRLLTREEVEAVFGPTERITTRSDF